MKRIVILGSLCTVIACNLPAQTKAEDVKQEIYSWKLTRPLGGREFVAVDTLPENYGQRSVPATIEPAYATTGTLGGPGETLIFFERQPMSQFFFKDALNAWLPTFNKVRFFNSRIPVTFLSYNTSGGKLDSQDRLEATFSGNINQKAQIGAFVDYLYSKGSYDYQATKALNWGLSGSYIGDRYEMQAFYSHWNTLGKNNGGITNDLYITDPAQLQGGQTSIEPKAIPTNLTGAHSKIVGGEFYMSHAYKVGFWKEEEVDDTTTVSTFVPVSSFHWILNYQTDKHIFKDTAADKDFWKNTYLNLEETDDRTNYWSLSNTVGVTLLEEFNKFAKFGLTAFATHEIRNYKQTTDTLDRLPEIPEELTPYPVNKIPSKKTENLFWVGGELSKNLGSIFTYGATAKFGLIGSVIGDMDIRGHISTRFRLLGDSVGITGYGHFKNEEVPYLLKQYVSNHFIWDNKFGKTRSFRFGGILNVPHTGTSLNVGAENIQNLVYFNPESLPTQNGGSVQVFSATLNQDLRLKAFNWENKVTYQVSSDEVSLPLPKLSVYSNMYVKFKVARVLDVQFGMDCNYYTRYKSVTYQPATMTFYNQRDILCGNYPVVNAYANMKLSKTRFYVLFSHVNQGLTGDNYFSMPHYPINPRRFQIGLSIDFAN
ncbi:MAG: putative porin [Bacteroides sp.]|nr:putative porin [Bacteroides sp.]MCM1389445.1 putative porin [Bacteroides sp.]